MTETSDYWPGPTAPNFLQRPAEQEDMTGLCTPALCSPNIHSCLLSEAAEIGPGDGGRIPMQRSNRGLKDEKSMPKFNLPFSAILDERSLVCHCVERMRPASDSVSLREYLPR